MSEGWGMTAIRPGLPPVSTPAQAGAAARAQQARASFFQTMQAQGAAPTPTQAVTAPAATPALTPKAPAAASFQPVAVQPETGGTQDSQPRLRRPGSLLNILV